MRLSVNTEAMNEHVIEISAQIAPGAHAVLVWMARAGARTASD